MIKIGVQITSDDDSLARTFDEVEIAYIDTVSRGTHVTLAVGPMEPDHPLIYITIPYESIRELIAEIAPYAK